MPLSDLVFEELSQQAGDIDADLVVQTAYTSVYMYQPEFANKMSKGRYLLLLFERTEKSHLRFFQHHLSG